MTWMDNFTQATVIMSLGMGLASLVVLIQVSARLLAKYAPEEPAPAPVKAAPAQNDGAVVAAIAAALRQYSSDKK